MKKLIKKASPMKWYHEFIGEQVKIKDEYFLNGKKYFVVGNSFIIAEEDCYTETEIREKKLNRISNN